MRVLEEHADVPEHGVPRFVLLAGRVLHELLAGALRHDDHRVVALAQPLLEQAMKPEASLQAEGHLGDQAEVDLGQREGRVGRDVAGHSVP